jgi:hypothetical protein
MLVQFKYPRKLQGLPDKDKDGRPMVVSKIFAASPVPQELPDSMANDWFFKSLVKSGDVAIVPPAIAASKSEKPEKASLQPQKK